MYFPSPVHGRRSSSQTPKGNLMKRQANALTALIGTSLLATGTALAGGPASNVIAVTTVADGINHFDGFCSLREAIDNANLNYQGSPIAGECPAGSAIATDVIVLASGETYELTEPGDGSNEGDLDLIQNLSIELDLRIETDGATGATIRQMVAGQRVLENHGLNIEIDNITLRGGSLGGGVGGGILNEGGVMRLTQAVVLGNSAISGAGIYTSGEVFLSDSQVVANAASLLGGGVLVDTDGFLEATGTQIRANTAVTGGGVYNAGGHAQLVDGVVNLNQATSGSGGGIHNATGGTLSVTEVGFEGNTASDKGGAINNSSAANIFVFDSSFVNNNAVQGGAMAGETSGDLHIVRSTFRENSSASHGGAVSAPYVRLFDSVLEDNTAFLGDGGAVHASIGLRLIGTTLSRNNADDGGGAHAQILEASDTVFTGNQAGTNGGGLYVWNHAEFDRVRFIDNAAAGNGGGLYLQAGSNIATLLKRSVATGNQAGAQGGGVWLGSEVGIGNTTINNNSASAGGGMYVAAGADVTALNMTLAGHLAGQDLHKFGKLTMGNSVIFTPGQPDCETTLDDPPIYTLGHNIVDDGSCFFDQSLPSDQLLTDPRLDALADNGGGTLTLALLPDSPAIDAGSNVLCADELVENVDQRGGERPQGAACDIGAFETGAILLEDAIFSNGFE